MNQERKPIRNRAENLKLKAELAMTGSLVAAGVGTVGLYEALGTTTRLDEIGAIMVVSLDPALGRYAVDIAIESGHQEAQMPIDN